MKSLDLTTWCVVVFVLALALPVLGIILLPIAVPLTIDLIMIPVRCVMDVFNGMSRYRRSLIDRNQASRDARRHRVQERVRRTREREAAAAQQSEQARRAEVRFQCQMLYDRHAGQLLESFPPERLQDYFERFLSDNSEAQAVELRGGQLRTMLEELAKSSGTTNQMSNPLAVIREEFDVRRNEVESAGFDAETTEALLAGLAREEEQAIREYGRP